MGSYLTAEEASQEEDFVVEDILMTFSRDEGCVHYVLSAIADPVLIRHIFHQHMFNASKTL